MHDVAANKALARKFIAALGRLDMDEFLGYLSEDVMFETPGQFPAAGIKTKADVALEFPAMMELLPDGLEFTIHTITAEDDRVHVELSGKSKTFDGQDYNNRYHYAFVIQDGLIVSFRDYMDSDLVMRVMIPTLTRHGAINLGKKSEPVAA